MPEREKEIVKLYPGDVDKCHRLFIQCRPFPGVTIHEGSVNEDIDTTSIDVVIVLLRALRSYGWLCQPVTEAEKAFQTIVELNLGWDEREDKMAKRALVESLFKNVTKADIEGFVFSDLFQTDMKRMICENMAFRLIDDCVLWRESPNSRWEKIELPPPYHTRAEFNWDGTTSLQGHVDKLFQPIVFPGRDGTSQNSKMFIGRMADFMYLPYNPIRTRKFEELARFDLNTLVRQVRDGKTVFCQQKTRYHILAIVNVTVRGCEDIRVYDDVGKEVLEYVNDRLRDKAKKRKQIPYWTVETAEEASFLLFYYQLLEREDWPVDKSNIPCDHVEYHERNDNGDEGTESSATGTRVSGAMMQDSVQTSRPLSPREAAVGEMGRAVPLVDQNTARLQQTNVRERWPSTQISQYERNNPLGTTDIGSISGRTSQTPAVPNAKTKARKRRGPKKDSKQENK